MSYTEKELLDAFKDVLGEEVVEALVNSRVSIPSIHDLVVKECFISDKPYPSLLAVAYRDLKRNGEYDMIYLS